MDYSQSQFSKGEPRKRTKARAKRKEKAVKASVREQVMFRDGYRCRLADSPRAQALFGACRGALQWSHWGPYKRSLTRGQAPERRHCREGGLALCDRHHDDADEGRMTIDALTPDLCNGRMRYAKGDVAWEEPQ